MNKYDMGKANNPRRKEKFYNQIMRNTLPGPKSTDQKL